MSRVRLAESEIGTLLQISCNYWRFYQCRLSWDTSKTNSQINYKAKGLALAGLAMCGEPTRPPQAAESFHTARAINKDAAYVKRVLLLLDAMAVVDEDGALADVRKAREGQ